MSTQEEISDIHYEMGHHLPTIQAVKTRYGLMYLDAEMRDAVEELLRQILEKRLVKLKVRAIDEANK